MSGSSQSLRKNSSKLAAEALLVAVALGWGVGFPLMKHAISGHPVFEVLWLRFVLAAVFMAPFCIRIEAWSRRTLLMGCLLGTVLFASFAFLIGGLHGTTALNTGLLSGLSIVWVPILGWVLFDEPIDARAAVGVVLCLAGVWVMSGGGIKTFSLGDLFVIVGSIFTALHIVSIDRFSGSHDAAALAFIQLLTVAVMAFAVSGVVSQRALTLDMDWGFAADLMLTASLSTAFAFWVQTKFQPETTPTRAAIIYNLEPAFSTLFAYLLLGETIGANILVACGLIIAGMSAPELWPIRGGRSLPHHQSWGKGQAVDGAERIDEPAENP